MCLNTGTPKNINFLFETNGKLMVLGVPIFKHFRVHRIADPNQTIYYGLSDVGQHYLPSQSDSFCPFSSNRCATYRRTTLSYYDYYRLQFCPKYSEIYSVK